MTDKIDQANKKKNQKTAPKNLLDNEAQQSSSQQQQQVDDALNDDEKGENDEKLSVVREQPLPNTGQVSRSVNDDAQNDGPPNVVPNVVPPIVVPNVVPPIVVPNVVPQNNVPQNDGPPNEVPNVVPQNVVPNVVPQNEVPNVVPLNDGPPNEVPPNFVPLVLNQMTMMGDATQNLSVQVEELRHENAVQNWMMATGFSLLAFATCLSLGVIVNNKQFLAHPCCQILLADLWHGGLRIRSNSNIKIFKSKRKRRRPSHSRSSTTAKEDIEMGKQRNRVTSRSTPMKEGPTLKAVDEDGVGGKQRKSKGREGRGVRALVAHSTIGAAAVPSATNSTGGSPLLSHAPLPLNNSMNHAWPTPKTYGAINPDGKSPHFLVGSDENIGDSSNEAAYYHPTTTSPTRHRRKKTALSENDEIPLRETNDYNKDTQNNETANAHVESESQPKNESLPRTPSEQIGRLTVNGGHVPKGIPLPEGVTLNKTRQIKYRRRLYEFFVAPITTFWAWTLSFLVFLSVLTYVLLIKTPPSPSYFEWYLFAYVVAFGLEITRKFFMSEPKKIKEKFEHFYSVCTLRQVKVLEELFWLSIRCFGQ
ncbi:hypothetical protein niasHS_013212 [Heterodera schachtii]|uniref:Uncharacterized protein n=1 Tax=Heterodera schachtii TaxID=97005 RepID=A0ABD2IV68_HETSC